ncbi:hypothetical protein [Geminicoccus harenae]|uniref:hypothetical protein n=1 Tax=Geminicoccus harenae TaxID=2498453 RepID=UPI00168AC2CA|nr:hypothetical protein [Geminicoccus harenae]
MIHTVHSLPVGNALRLFLSPPADALRWRILRKGTDDFAGPEDPGAVLVYVGDEKAVLDTKALTNDLAAFYRPFYWIDGAWVDGGASASGTPRATYQDASTDVLTVVRDRLAAGLEVELQRNVLRHPTGQIQVLTAPPQADNARLPLVTVQLVSEEPPERAAGDELDTSFDAIGGVWVDSEGWLARVTLSVTGWSLNPQERNALRQALRRIIVANLPVFDDAGMLKIEFSMQDHDAVNDEFKAPLYLTNGSLVCLAPVVVTNEVQTIRVVETDLLAD